MFAFEVPAAGAKGSSSSQTHGGLVATWGLGIGVYANPKSILNP